jgi:LPS-assembly protein
MAAAPFIHLPGHSQRRHAAAALLGMALACLLPAALALADSRSDKLPWVGIPKRTSVPTASSTLAAKKADPNAQMFVQADQLDYDYTGDRVVASGQVQLHYLGSVLEADKVIYDQKTKRLHAEGNVRLTEADGKIINAQQLDLDESFRDGFVDSLHVETSDKTHIAAVSANVSKDKEQNRLTVFQSGVYTACEPCKDNPKKPPKWQVKATRIIHDETEKTIYFEDARLELFGLPVMYMPYFWTPDPTVKKKTGFLTPSLVTSNFFGAGFMTPFFWNIAPDYDLTLSPMFTTRQGPLMTAEWRQRLLDGAYSIRASGIFQEDKEAFAGTTGYRDFRGAVETKGDFRLSQNWYWGWNGSLFTDNSFTPQYHVTTQGQEVVSQAYLFGRGANSYFDARSIYVYGLSALDKQNQLPFVAPVIDYKYKFADPVFGGELSYNINFTNINRREADFDPASLAAAAKTKPDGTPLYFDGLNVCDSADPAAVKTRADCLLRGIAGNYSRLSAEVQWRRTLIDSYGQIFTPFLWARGDVAALELSRDFSQANFIDPGSNSLARVMPAVGLDYKYPFISTHSWGTQIIEPHVQVIARPNESQIGRFPNEDSQALLFSDANLFSISKFPGYDRVEGGGRANVGLEYTAQFNKGGYVNALFGQSYQLFGLNSYAVTDAVNGVQDTANAGLQSGLETPASDYVARLTYSPDNVYAFTSRFAFDQKTFTTKRLELEGRVNFDRWTAGLTYGRYEDEPAAGLLLPREGILPSATLKLSPNWQVTGSALYSLDTDRLNTVSVGIGYIDECIALNLLYSASYGYLGTIVPSKMVMLQFTLRTLGGSDLRQTVGGLGSNGSSNFFSGL